MAQSTCEVPENGARCVRPGRVKRGMCPAHYSRWRKHGNPTTTVNRPAGELDRLLRQGVTAETDECVILAPKTRRPTARIDGRGANASRAVWIMAHGDPGDLWVLHTCHRGDEGCINLRHLRLGDVKQNMRDMDEAGRRRTPDRSGEANGRHKLTEAQAEGVRRRYAAGGVRQVDLAEEFGVSQAVISSITRGDRWVPDKAARRPASAKRKRPTAETVEAIRARWAGGGISQQALADEFGVSQTLVSQIARGAR